MYKDSFLGKPSVPVVDKVKFYKNNLSDPVVTDFSYAGGIMDVGGDALRFSRTSVSQPFLESESSSKRGLSIHQFFNDIKFVDQDLLVVDTTEGTTTDSCIFWHRGVCAVSVDNPIFDYILDGVQYYSATLDSVEQLSTESKFDFSKNYFSIREFEYNSGKFYKTFLDSTYSRTDSLDSFTKIEYDSTNMLPSSTWRRQVINSDTSYFVDSVIYAYEIDTIMENSNALIQPYEQISFYDSVPNSSGDEVLLSKTRIEYEKHGSWKPVRSYIWKDLSDANSIIKTSEVSSFSTKGYPLVTTDISGITNCIKLDSSAFNVIVEAKNSLPGDLLVQDFEQFRNDYRWDNWDNGDIVLQFLDSTNVFTGTYSCLLIDKPSSGPTWGPNRTILSDSLTDSLYTFSCWVKSNYSVDITVLSYCDNDNYCDIGNTLTKTFNNLDSSKWTRIDGTFNLAETIDSLYKIKVFINLSEYTGTDSVFAYFDNFRFHPYDAIVSTSVFDKNNGLLLSSSNNNNYPFRYYYDDLFRVKNTSDHRNKILTKIDYQLTYDTLQIYKKNSYIWSAEAKTSGSKIVYSDHDQLISYSLKMYNFSASDTSWSKIYINNQCIDSLVDYGGAGTIYDSLKNTIFVYKNDTVYIEVNYAPNGFYDGYATAQISYETSRYPPYDVENPNYVLTTTFSDNDSIITANFYDGSGNVIQTRSSGYNDSTVLVSFSDYDIYGNILKNYKTYYDDHAPLIDTVISIDTTFDGIDGGYHRNSDFASDSLADIDTIYFFIWEDGYFDYSLSSLNRKTDEGISIYLKDTLIIDFVNHDQALDDINPCYADIYNDSVGTFLVNQGDNIKIILNNSITCDLSSNEIKETYCSILYSIFTYSEFDTTITIDTVIVNGITDYDYDSTYSKVDAYYSDTGAGLDHGGVPYSEKEYSKGIKSKLTRSASAGSTWALDSGYESEYISYTDTLAKELVSMSYDPDSVLVLSKTDRWGRYEKKYSLIWDNSIDDYDSVLTYSFKDRKGQVTSVWIDTSLAVTTNDSIKIREYFYNDLGQLTAEWRVDYGTIRMLYDLAGNKRFMQNDKRLAEDNSVYFKYDDQGRIIEEGVIDSASIYFDQTYADSLNFPETGQAYTYTSKYKYTYDYIQRIQGTDTLECNCPGQLVRTEKIGSYQYFKEFYTFPSGDSDMTIIRLPQPVLPSLKAITRRYNMDGSMKSMTVYPHWPSISDNRTYSYDYYNNGQLKSINDGSFMLDEERTFAEYEYNIDGSVDLVRYGVYHSTPISGPISDTTQIIRYSYDTRGMLTSIADTANVIASNYGSGEDSLHFGLSLEYLDSVNGGFANGRVHKINSSSSTGSSVSQNNYEYDYNNLGWLTLADNITDNNLDREYIYNRLGNRKTLISGNDTIVYVYDTLSDSGSSILLNYTGMNKNYTYDQIGNMTSDSSRNINLMTYEYRNLMDYSKMTSTVDANSSDELFMTYDETGMRIKKEFKYKYWDDCFGGGIENFSSGSGSSDLTQQSGNLSNFEASNLGSGGTEALGAGPGGEQCLKTASVHTYYLYDNGVLLATFDENDNVLESFVNSQEGMIASYKNDDDNLLYYYLRDQIGSPRVILHSTPTASTKTTVAQSINYHPFGAVSVAIGSYDTPYKFTGKENDLHGNFEFTYFGARYYNPETGYFSSIDKAGQFTSGYLYGGNNPISTIDPDGNFATWVVALAGVGIAMNYQANEQRMEGIPWYMNLAISSFQAYISYQSAGAASGYGGANLLYSIGAGVRDATALTVISNVSNLNDLSSIKVTDQLGFTIASGISNGALNSQQANNFINTGELRSYKSTWDRTFNDLNRIFAGEVSGERMKEILSKYQKLGIIPAGRLSLTNKVITNREIKLIDTKMEASSHISKASKAIKGKFGADVIFNYEYFASESGSYLRHINYNIPRGEPPPN